MARDDMFSWLNDMKNSRKSPKSPPSGPESTNQERRENKAVPPPATKEDELELQPTIAAVGNARELTQESVTETISQWVGSILGNPQEPDKQMVAHDLPSPPVNPRPAHEIATEISPNNSLNGKAGLVHPDKGATKESSGDLAPSQRSPVETLNEAPDETQAEAQATPEPPLSINEQQRILEVLTKARHEPKPQPGMAAMELAPPRLRPARVLAVKAGGRRVTARIEGIDRIYSYTLRTDKTYRLEGVPTKTAPRLILDVEV